jgi:hypothetical protein
MPGRSGDKTMLGGMVTGANGKEGGTRSASEADVPTGNITA